MILHATKAGVKKVTNECNAVRHGMEVNAISNERKNGRRTNVRARSANRKVGEVYYSVRLSPSVRMTRRRESWLLPRDRREETIPELKKKSLDYCRAKSKEE